MKKIIVALLCVSLILYSSGVGVFAETGKDDNRIEFDQVFNTDTVMQLGICEEQENGTYNAHSEINIVLNLKENSGFSAMRLSVSWGNSNITLKNVVSSFLNVDYSDQGGSAVINLTKAESVFLGNGNIAILTFYVGDFLGDVHFYLSAKNGDICDIGGNLVPFKIQEEPLSLNINCIYGENHNYIVVEEIPANCSENGKIVYRCNGCGKEKITITNATGICISDGKQIRIEPTCDTDGRVVVHCIYCLREIIITSANADSSLKAKGHSYGEYILIKEPTCTELGYSVRYCNNCGDRQVSQTAALGHDSGTWRVTYPADCTNQGVSSCHCNRCDQVIATKQIAAVGSHTMAWAITKQPTCAEEGLEEYACLVCGYVDKSKPANVIAKKEHVHGQEEITIEPTCFATGLAQTKCLKCNNVVSERIIDKLPHQMGALRVDTAPTYTTEGSGHYCCAVCKEELKAVTIPTTQSKITVGSAKISGGETVKIPVTLEGNTGLSVARVRIKYDPEKLTFQKVSVGEITNDITVSNNNAGEIVVLLSIAQGEYTKNGVMFYLEFSTALTQDATDIEIYCQPSDDYCDKEGNLVFFNLQSGRVEIKTDISYDVNGNGKVDTADLAFLKLCLAGIEVDQDILMGCDINLSGTIDTTDLSLLKIRLIKEV